jgi:tRNA-binding protein
MRLFIHNEIKAKVNLIIISMAVFEDFQKLDIRVGKIIEVKDFPEARKPSYILRIDFGSEIGVKTSSAQLPNNYTKQELIGKLVLGVVNFPIRQIGPVQSEVLTLGIPDENHNCILAVPDKDVPVGGQLY